MIGIFYGPIIGMTCGLITGILCLIGSPYIIHPVQLLLDYILPSMLLGVSGLFDCKNKNKIFIGCLLAVLLKETSLYFWSICFAEYAGMVEPIAYQ